MKSKKGQLGIKFSLSLTTLLLIVGISFTAFAVDGQIKVAQTSSTTFPIIINKAGSYVLTSNLVVADPSKHAIEITVNDVTIDLNGHKIQGPGAGSGCGIYAQDRYNITIENGRIWGFGNFGIYFTFSGTASSTKGAGHRIESIQAMNNLLGGILIVGGVLRNCVANKNNNTGNVFFSGGIIAVNSIVIHSTANNNIAYGLIVYDSIVIQCTANYNNRAGIFDGTISSGGNRIEGSNVRNNAGHGIYLFSTGNYAICNVGSDNGSSPADNFFATIGNHMPLTGDNANYGF